jgi:hypothetical protein
MGKILAVLELKDDLIVVQKGKEPTCEAYAGER